MPGYGGIGTKIRSYSPLPADAVHGPPVRPQAAQSQVPKVEFSRPSCGDCPRANHFQTGGQRLQILFVDRSFVVAGIGSQNDRLPAEFLQVLGKISDAQCRRITAGRKIRSDDQDSFQLLDPDFLPTTSFIAIRPERRRRHHASRQEVPHRSPCPPRTCWSIERERHFACSPWRIPPPNSPHPPS